MHKALITTNRGHSHRAYAQGAHNNRRRPRLPSIRTRRS